MFFHQILRRIVSRGWDSSLFSGIRPIIKSMLLEGTLPLSSVANNSSFGVFNDMKGNKFYLIGGVRDAVTPGWREELKLTKKGKGIPEPRDIKITVKRAFSSVRDMLAFVECFGFQVQDKIVLEIGCYNGSRTYALAAAGSRKCIGSDISRYYVISDENSTRLSEETISEHRKKLTELRFEVAKTAIEGKFISEPKINQKVEFVEDDITCSSLPSNYFDLLCSWEVLEHVSEPPQVFQQMHRILKPGGLAFHEYNPFFALNGGHGPCTLDFFWGHAMLSNENFEKYIRELRPEEFSNALNYYRHSLNRMTLSDLKKYSQESGLETLAIIPWSLKSHLELLSPDVLRLTKEITPSLMVEDLVSPFIWILHRKPTI